MKKTVILVVGLLMMAAGAYVAFAAPPAWNARMAQRGGRPMRWEQSERGPKSMCPMHMAMMRAMTDKQMHVTDDGEIIVMIGCQLFKYDANLSLIGRTQVEIDFEAVQKKMRQMMENCPMQDQMPQENEGTDGDNNQN